jgi:hypothetical protein
VELLGYVEGGGLGGESVTIARGVRVTGAYDDRELVA